MNNPTPGLTGLLGMSTIMTPPATLASQDNLPSTGETSSLMPSYALGGMVGPGGEPIRPNIPGLPGLSGPSSGGMGLQQMELEARRFVQQNPQQVAEIREAVEEALADGDITMDQVKVLSNMARVALQNPEMYPQLKQAILSQGILEQDELPDEFDQGVMFILLLIGQIVQSSPAQPGMPVAGSEGGSAAPTPVPGNAQQPMMSMKKGGQIPMKSEMEDDMDDEDDMEDDKEDDGAVPIMAHEGEYVIPSHIVRAKGTEFFDKLVQSYTPSKK